MLTHSRTDQEILARIDEVKPTDFFGHQLNDLIPALSFEAAKPFLKDEYIKEGPEEWDKGRAEIAINPGDKIRDYLAFAWDKANNCRGLSAARSIEHFMSWTWLDGKDEITQFIEEYNLYGKPQLVVLSELYGFDWQSHDDGEWKNGELHPPLGTQELAERIEQARAKVAYFRERYPDLKEKSARYSTITSKGRLSDPRTEDEDDH